MAGEISELDIYVASIATPTMVAERCSCEEACVEADLEVLSVLQDSATGRVTFSFRSHSPLASYKVRA